VIVLAPLFIKLLVCPAVVLLMDIISTEVDYRAVYQAVMVGLILAVLGRILENFLLRSRTVWISTAVDFVAATVVLYFSPLVFPGSRVTFTGALVTALLLAVTEYIQHVVLVQRRKYQ
jgi:hypothetical protein